MVHLVYALAALHNLGARSHFVDLVVLGARGMADMAKDAVFRGNFAGVLRRTNAP